MSASHDGRLTEVAFIRKLKRPDGSGMWPAYRTGEDRFGTWLFTPQGSLYRGEKAGVAVCCNVGSPVGPGIAVMHLVPWTGWWIATFWDQAEPRWRATVDICTPPRLSDGVWTYTDLELDVLTLHRLAAEPADALFIDDTPGHVTAAVAFGMTGHLHTSTIGTITRVEDFLN
jgi:hypothetical protein